MKKSLPALPQTLAELDSWRQKGWRPQVVGCFIYRQKVLMVFDKKYRLWQFPQGGIEPHTTISQAFKDEMIEELGSDFYHQTDKKLIYFLTADIEFPLHQQSQKILTTDAGQEVPMLGKHYFFFASQANNPDLNIKEIEFDDYRWLTYDEARELANKINQAGKKRTTLAAVDGLFNLGLII